MDTSKGSNALSASPKVYQFGDYRLMIGSGLTQSGKFVRLAPKELGVLEALVERCGQLVSKDELLDEVWPNETVGEESLTRCIYVLRQCLRKRLDNPIATVHARGYRFAVPVKVVHAPSPRSVVEKSVDTSAIAHMTYLEGRQHLRAGPIDALGTAIRYYEDAARLDPDFAVAFAAIADCRIQQCTRRLISPRLAVKHIHDVCRRALEIDPLLASAHAALGWVQSAVEWDHVSAMAALDRAVELDCEYAGALRYRAWALSSLGSHTAAIADLSAATQLDPYMWVHQTSLAWSLLVDGQHLEALHMARSAVANFPDLSIAHAYLCCIAAFLGKESEALSEVARVMALGQSHSTDLSAAAYALGALGKFSQARDIVARIESQGLPVVMSLMIPVYVALGDTEQADTCTAVALTERCPWLLRSLYDPRLGSYRSRMLDLFPELRIAGTLDGRNSWAA